MGDNDNQTDRPEDDAPQSDDYKGDDKPSNGSGPDSGSGDQGNSGGGDAPAGDNGGDSKPGDSTGDGVKLYVGNLDYQTDEQRLRDEFGQFGTVTDVFLPMERGTQRPRGFGFVTLSTREAAEKAISKMDQ